jgi:threonine dehydrogenase-like Zn-dependent dehydrogenase
MPQRLIAKEPRVCTYESYEDIPLRVNEVRVQTEYASPKHGSELPAFSGDSPHLNENYDKEWTAFLPKALDSAGFSAHIPGNQFVGIVTEIGSEVTRFAIGDRVCGYGAIAQTQVLSEDHRNLFAVPESMSWKNAVCYDPAQYALSAIRDGQVRLGDRVAVFGLGAIGALAVQMAKLAGASFVAAIDPLDRRRLAALQTGADLAIDPLSEDAGLRLKQETSKLGVDVVIDTSAHPTALQAALRGIAWSGNIVYAGWARPFAAGLDLGKEAHFNLPNLIFSRAVSEPGRDHPRWTFRRIELTCWDMLQGKALDCESIVDPVVPFLQSAAAYERYVDRHPEESVKMGVAFTQEGDR